jgi:hypothetical protein
LEQDKERVEPSKSSRTIIKRDRLRLDVIRNLKGERGSIQAELGVVSRPLVPDPSDSIGDRQRGFSGEATPLGRFKSVVGIQSGEFI